MNQTRAAQSAARRIALRGRVFAKPAGRKIERGSLYRKAKKSYILYVGLSSEEEKVLEQMTVEDKGESEIATNCRCRQQIGPILRLPEALWGTKLQATTMSTAPWGRRGAGETMLAGVRDCYRCVVKAVQLRSSSRMCRRRLYSEKYGFPERTVAILCRPLRAMGRRVG